MNKASHIWWVVIFGLVAVMFLRLPPLAARHDSVLGAYRALVEVDALARQYYVEPIQDDRLIHGALRGLMQQLDPYSGYIAPGELGDFLRRSSGDYFGLGLELGNVDGRATVIAAVEGSPAARAGIRSGDVIRAVNGRETEKLSVFEIDGLIGRDPQAEVRLLVEPAGGGDTREVAVRPGVVSIVTVKGFRRGPDGAWDYVLDADRGIGYIRVNHFSGNTLAAFGEALRALDGRNIRALVLDLRYNPGGLLEEGVAMVDHFLDDVLIVSTITRRGAVLEYRATNDPPAWKWQLAVLINGGSASASEIVAGSLQDHRRAVIVGERSFGKGSVQKLLPLQSNQGAIKLTMAYYQLPGGRTLHRDRDAATTDPWGVTPDVAVPLSAEEWRAVEQARTALDDPQAGSGGTLLVDRQLQAAIDQL